MYKLKLFKKRLISKKVVTLVIALLTLVPIFSGAVSASDVKKGACLLSVKDKDEASLSLKAKELKKELVNACIDVYSFFFSVYKKDPGNIRFNECEVRNMITVYFDKQDIKSALNMRALNTDCAKRLFENTFSFKGKPAYIVSFKPVGEIYNQYCTIRGALKHVIAEAHEIEHKKRMKKNSFLERILAEVTLDDLADLKRVEAISDLVDYVCY